MDVSGELTTRQCKTGVGQALRGEIYAEAHTDRIHPNAVGGRGDQIKRADDTKHGGWLNKPSANYLGLGKHRGSLFRFRLDAIHE